MITITGINNEIKYQYNCQNSKLSFKIKYVDHLPLDHKNTIDKIWFWTSNINTGYNISDYIVLLK